MTAAALLGACSDTTVHIPAANAIPIPTFQTVPDDLSRSTQLQALQARDTAGIEFEGEGVAVDLLPAAIAALEASDDAPRNLSRLAIYAESVDFAYEQNGINGRSVNAIYRSGEEMYFSDPSFDDSDTFAIDLIDPGVPANLVTAIEEHVPNGLVTRIDLNVSSSYGFGLVWNIEVTDARGTLATVFAELDGAIVAVEEND
jgi:hypothetical protein